MKQGLLMIALCFFCISLSLQNSFKQFTSIAIANSSQQSPFYRLIISPLHNALIIYRDGWQGLILYTNNYTVNITIKIKDEYLDIDQNIQQIPIEFQLDSQFENSSYTDLLKTLNSQTYKISRNQHHILTVQIEALYLQVDFLLFVYLSSFMVLGAIRIFQGDFFQQLKKFFSIRIKFYCKGWSCLSHNIRQISVYQNLYTWGIVVSRFKFLSNFNSSWSLFPFNFLIFVYCILTVVVSLRFRPSSRIIFYHYLFYCTLMAFNFVKTDYALNVIILLQVYELSNVYFGNVLRETVFGILDVWKIIMFHVSLLFLCRKSQKIFILVSFGLSVILVFASIDRVHVYNFIVMRIRKMPYLKWLHCIPILSKNDLRIEENLHQ